VHDGDTTNFFCDDCGACWFFDLGWIGRVNPSTCPGCKLRDRCRALAAAKAARG
jgi:hypothetical protein